MRLGNNYHIDFENAVELRLSKKSNPNHNGGYT